MNATMTAMSIEEITLCFQSILSMTGIVAYFQSVKALPNRESQRRRGFRTYPYLILFSPSF